jgi:hypothetical protein
MSETQHPTRRPHEPGQYAIRVAGRLDQRWAEWFDGLSLTHQGDGTTVLQGRVADQASLHGLLLKIRDLGLPLLSVTPVVPDRTTEQPDATTSTPTPGSTP